MNESSQAKENPVCLWVPSNNNSCLLETAVDNCRNLENNVKIFILDNTKELINANLINRIKPDYHLISTVDGISSRKGWESLKGILKHIVSLCHSGKYPGVYIFNDTTILSKSFDKVNNIFSLFDKNAGLSGFRNKGAPFVDSSVYWISSECAKDCLGYIQKNISDQSADLSESISISLIAYNLGHYVQILEDDYLTVYDEIKNTNLKPIVDFRNAYKIYINKSDRQKLIKEKAATV
jgi:hypothetical protein